MAEMLADNLLAMEDNLVGHFAYLPRLTTGMEVQEAPAIVLVDSGLPCDTFNVIYCQKAVSAAAVGEALSHFRSRGLPFTVWCSPRAGDELAASLEGLGLQRTETETGMLLRPQSFVPASSPAVLNVAKVQDATRLDDFARVLAANWTPPDAQIIQFFQRSQDAVLRSEAPMRLFVGYWDDEAAATCEVFRTGKVAGIYNVATRSKYRQLGVATAMVSFAIEDAIRDGCQLVSLQASAGAEDIYARLGFRACCEVTTFQVAKQGLAPCSDSTWADNGGRRNPMKLVHCVYFSLNDRSDDAKQKLVASCRKHLTGHRGTVVAAVSVLADQYARSVNDRDFDVAWTIVFEDAAAHDEYQKSERHLAFVAENDSTLKKKRVFDSLVVE